MEMENENGLAIRELSELEQEQVGGGILFVFALGFVVGFNLGVGIARAE